MSEPLNFAMLEVMLAGAEPTWGRDHELVATLRRLVMVLRETRAALYPYVVSSQPSSTLLDRACAALAQAVEGG